MKRTEAQSIGEIFDEVLRQNHLDDSFNEQKACFLWPEVVGPHINRRTTRRYVDHGVMHVYISSGPLKSELEFLKSRIIQLLNDAVGTPVIKSLMIH